MRPKPKFVRTITGGVRVRPTRRDFQPHCGVALSRLTVRVPLEVSGCDEAVIAQMLLAIAPAEAAGPCHRRRIRPTRITLALVPIRSLSPERSRRRSMTARRTTTGGAFLGVRGSQRLLL